MEKERAKQAKDFWVALTAYYFLLRGVLWWMLGGGSQVLGVEGGLVRANELGLHVIAMLLVGGLSVYVLAEAGWWLRRELGWRGTIPFYLAALTGLPPGVLFLGDTALWVLPDLFYVVGVAQVWRRAQRASV